MKSSVYEQFAIVQSDSAALFTAKLNETIYRLRNSNPVVKFSEADPLCAYIHYVVYENTPETVAEASEMEGVHFVCAQCPYFHPIMKEDGTPDKRVKWGDCEYAELGRTMRMASACDKLYETIKEGDVKICFTE